MFDFENLQTSPASRRQFLATMSAAGLGLAASNLLAGGVTASAKGNDLKFKDVQAVFPGIPGQTINEIILNYALTLEILEADLYRQALNVASGLPITTKLNKDPATYSRTVSPGGLTSAQANAGYLYLVQFSYVEAAHREFLAAAITASGGTPTTRNPGGYRFPQGPGENVKQILTNILPLEETGVRAYLGALPYFTDLNLGVVAGGIYSTECRHSGAIGTILGKPLGPFKMDGDLEVTKRSLPENTFEKALAPSTVITAVSAFFK